MTTGALTLVSCSGGGGDDHASESTTPTAPTSGESTGGVDGTTVEQVTDEHTTATDGHASDAGDAGHGSSAAGTVSKAAFDELRLQVAELRVEVDRLQVLAGLNTAGETPEEEHESDESHGDTPHWTYEEADRWGELAAEFSACSAGTEQSPIDLAGSIGLDLPNIDTNYRPADATIVDNGHTVQVNVPEAGTLELDGEEYQFVQFHFHAPSEHTIEGDHWPMEWHFVHRAVDGSLAVFGVLVEEGPAWPGFDDLIVSLPMEDGREEVVAAQVDVSVFLPELTAAYHYDGSLTTPPCSEDVSWSVLQGSITMSAEQMAAFSGRLEEPNNRPVQPTNGRVLEKDVSA